MEPAYLDSLIEEYGSPLFLVSAEKIRENLKTFTETFREKYPKSEVAYAYKANYLPGVLRIIHSEGAWAEVSSGFEYDIAGKMGVPGESIVFNGPGKTKEQLKKALSEGALVNADNKEEIGLLSEIAREMGKPADVGIRISVDVGINQKADRFGFALESGEAAEIVELCAASGLLNVICLHVHLTSYIVEPDAGGQRIPARNVKLIWPKSADMYETAAGKISKFAREVEKKTGGAVKYLDMGGGFPSVDSLGPYVSAVTAPLLVEFGEKTPVLILEPGRAVVKDAVSLVATVLASRKLPDGQRAVTIDAGINVLPSSYWTSQEVTPLRHSGRKEENSIIYGPLCLQTDIVARTFISELEPGDRVVAKNVGAYNIPQSSSFIRPRPNVVMLEDGRTRIIAEAETADDVLKHGRRSP